MDRFDRRTAPEGGGCAAGTVSGNFGECHTGGGVSVLMGELILVLIQIGAYAAYYIGDVTGMFLWMVLAIYIMPIAWLVIYSQMHYQIAKKNRGYSIISICATGILTGLISGIFVLTNFLPRIILGLPVLFVIVQFVIQGIEWLTGKIMFNWKGKRNLKKTVPAVLIGNMAVLAIAIIYFYANSYYLQVSGFGARPWIVLSESTEYNEEADRYDITYQSLGFRVVYSTADLYDQENEERYDRIANLYFFNQENIGRTWFFE